MCYKSEPVIVRLASGSEGKSQLKCLNLNLKSLTYTGKKSVLDKSIFQNRYGFPISGIIKKGDQRSYTIFDGLNVPAIQ